MEQSSIETIIKYGNRYYKENLENYDKEKILNSAWEGFRFLVDKIFFQGRNDNVSEEIRKRVIEVLEASEFVTNWTWTDKDLEVIRGQTFEKNVGRGGNPGNVGKPRDVTMLISCFEFVRDKVDRGNIVAFSCNRIREGKIQEHYKELQGEYGGIMQIGPKIASFYLRDLVMVFQFEEFVPVEFQSTLQPIDTWVEQVSKKLKIVSQDATHIEIKQRVVEICKTHNISPMLFNAGCWYIGKNSFEIVIENLGKL